MATRIPINKDHFDDRQKKIWEDMEHDMERRRREWEGEIDKMRSEFFSLRPDKAGALDFDRLDGPPGLSPGLSTQLPARIADVEDGKPVIDKDERGQPVFKVRFNMKEYRPEEVNVKMDSNKIIVSAKHEEKSTGSSVSREYNREVNVPVEVDPLALQCLFQPDGFLVFTAPIPAPKYNAIKEAPVNSPQGSSVKSSSSYQSSSSNKLNGSNGGISHSPQLVTHMMNPLQQSKVQHVSQQHSAVPHSFTKPVQSAPFPSTSSTSKFSSSVGTAEHPDHIVPSFRPPPDINKLLDTPPSLPMHSSPLSKPPPFNTLSSTFPAGPIFPESNQLQLSAPMVTSQDGKFQLTMPIDDFKPEELTVKTQDRKVIICAKRQMTDGNRNHTMEMNREHSLPDNVDPLTVKAFFTDTNMLIVEAPFL